MLNILMNRGFLSVSDDLKRINFTLSALIRILSPLYFMLNLKQLRIDFLSLKKIISSEFLNFLLFPLQSKKNTAINLIQNRLHKHKCCFIFFVGLYLQIVSNYFAQAILFYAEELYFHFLNYRFLSEFQLLIHLIFNIFIHNLCIFVLFIKVISRVDLVLNYFIPQFKRIFVVAILIFLFLIVDFYFQR